MATRYGVTWLDEQGQERTALWAFREGAALFFGGLCDEEHAGGGVSRARMEYYGPNGERYAGPLIASDEDKQAGAPW